MSAASAAAPNAAPAVQTAAMQQANAAFYPNGIFKEECIDLLLPPHGFVHDYVKNHASQVTDAYAPYHVAMALGLLAVVANPELKAKFNALPLYPNLFVLIVGAAGHERKSHSVKLGLALLRDATPSREMSSPGSREAFIDMMIAKEQESSMGGMATSYAQALIPYEEFDSFLVQAQDRGHLAPLKSEYLAAWDASPIARPLAASVKKKQATRCERPRLSITAAVATPLLEKHSTYTDWTGGFFSRFLCIYGQRVRHRESSAEADATHDEMFQQLSARLRDLAAVPMVGVCMGLDTEVFDVLKPNENGELVPTPMSASILWREFEATIDAHAQNVSRDDKASSVLSRLAPNALKAALLFSYDMGVTQAAQWRIPYEALAPAVNIAWVHLASARFVLERICDGKDQRDMQMVQDAVTVGPSTLGDILNRTKLMKKRAMECIETLRERGLIAGAKSGRKLVYSLGNENKDDDAEGEFNSGAV